LNVTKVNRNLKVTEWTTMGTICTRINLQAVNNPRTTFTFLCSIFVRHSIHCVRKKVATLFWL